MSRARREKLILIFFRLRWSRLRFPGSNSERCEAATLCDRHIVAPLRRVHQPETSEVFFGKSFGASQQLFVFTERSVAAGDAIGTSMYAGAGIGTSW